VIIFFRNQSLGFLLPAHKGNADSGLARRPGTRTPGRVIAMMGKMIFFLIVRPIIDPDHDYHV